MTTSDIFSTNQSNSFGIYHLVRKRRPEFNTGLSIATTTSSTVSSATSPPQIPEKCVCRYLWRKELHGLSQLMMSSSLISRIFWFLILVGCFVAAIWNAQYILGSFTEHNTATRMKIKQVKSMELPQMVFCPNYPDALHYDVLVEDMIKHIGFHLNETYRDILLYMIAGSGFDGVPMYQFAPITREGLRQNLELWRGNRTVLDFFKFVFETNGITCEEFFYNCYAGSKMFNCCDVFDTTYVMLRGRCFKLRDYVQNGSDELSKLQLQIRPFQSAVISPGVQPAVIMHLGGRHQEIAVFPRCYFNLYNWNKLRFEKKSINSLPSNPKCSTDPRNQGRATCSVYRWLLESIVGQYNCTLPYYKEVLDYMYMIPACDPSVVVDNYDDIKWARLERYKCLPACSRNEVQLSITSTYDNLRDSDEYGYTIEVAYSDLQYEEFVEVHTLTLQGFISELGGQTGLFLGISLITFIQLIVSISVFKYNEMADWIQRKYLL